MLQLLGEVPCSGAQMLWGIQTTNPRCLTTRPRLPIRCLMMPLSQGHRTRHLLPFLHLEIVFMRIMSRRGSQGRAQPKPGMGLTYCQQCKPNCDSDSTEIEWPVAAGHPLHTPNTPPGYTFRVTVRCLLQIHEALRLTFLEFVTM